MSKTSNTTSTPREREGTPIFGAYFRPMPRCRVWHIGAFKRLLKALGRAYGLECTRVWEKSAQDDFDVREASPGAESAPAANVAQAATVGATIAVSEIGPAGGQEQQS